MPDAIEIIVSGDGTLNSEHNADPQEVTELEQGLLKPQPQQPEDKKDKDAKKEDGDEPAEDDDEDEERQVRVDEELRDAHTPEERERIRAERKQSRIDRRNRAREREASLRREVQSEREQRLALERRVAGMENTQAGVELGQIDAAEQQANNAIETLQNIIADATVKADGRAVALATTRLQEALLYRNQVVALKERATAAARAPKQQHVDPVQIERSRTWIGRNKWYKGPNSNDPDSKVLTAIDNSLGAEGWDPRTDEYWQELDARAKKYLPHRINGAAVTTESKDNTEQSNSNTEQRRSTPKQPVAGAGNNGNGSQGTNGKNTMILSAERVKAMKENGSWEDPKRKADMIRRYREMDAALRRS